MRNLKKIVSSGCFFLCLGGWVYSGQLSRAQEVSGGTGASGASAAREAVLNAAAAQAATPGAISAATPDSAIAQVTENPTVTPAGTAVTTSGAPVSGAPASATPVQAKPTDLSTPTVNIEVDGRVKQINMQDMDINTALYFFSLQTKRNIIASKNVKGSVTVNLYNVTFQEALDAMLRPNGFDYIEKGNFIYVYTAEELADIRKRDRHTVNKIIHLHYTTALDASTLIKPMLSSTGQVAITAANLSGLSEGNTDTGSMNYAAADTLVINDFPENVDEVVAALKDIDVRPKQVLIESTVLNASLNDENALGIDLISISGADFSSLTSGALTTSASSAGSTSSSGSTGSTGAVVNGPTGLFNNFLGNKPQANIGTDFASSVPSGGLSVGFLSNNIAMFMRALETVTDVTVVANPKILALNKQKGEVHIGQKLGYLTTSTTTTTTQQTVQFLDVGTKLIFRPFIAEDGYVRMEIHPEDSSGVIDSRGVPQTNTTEVTSNIMIKDGRTIVIGGLFSESTTGSKGQVPILGNIPILGVPFRKTDDITHRQEIESVLDNLFQAPLQALGLAVFYYLYGGRQMVVTFVGLNGLLLFYYLIGNLRHSHLWLSFGPKLEHILCSPAQHQIHHSSAPRHVDTNFAQYFAFLDWIAGTLYVPMGQEELEFGLIDGPDPELTTLWSLYWVPVKRAFRGLLPTPSARASGSPVA